MKPKKNEIKEEKAENGLIVVIKFYKLLFSYFID